MKRGLVFSLYSPGREQLHKELEDSLEKDLVNFDFIKLPEAPDRRFMAPENAVGYDYARDKGYEFVARIDDDDLIVPGALSLFMKLLDENSELSGISGGQVSFYGEVPSYTLPETPTLNYKKYEDFFHGVTLYRTESLYPVVDDWRLRPGYDIHRGLVRNMRFNKHKKHTLGFIEETTCFWRRRDKNNNY